jgi:hypothetical protein
MERNFNVDRRFQIFCDKLTSNNVSTDLIIESSYNSIDFSSTSVIFDGHVDLSMVTTKHINISNISEIETTFLRVNTITLPSNVRITYNSVNDGYIRNTRVGYNPVDGSIGRSDAYFTYINVSGGDSSFNNSLYINKNLHVDGIVTISNELLIDETNFASIETSFNIYKAVLEQNFYIDKILTNDVSALAISVSNELVVVKNSFIYDLTISGQLLNNVLKVPSIFTIDPSGYDNHSGTLIINGDLNVTGNETTFSSSDVEIHDAIITLASNLANIQELSNTNAGLDISNIASLKYNGTLWNFSGGQLSVGNNNVLFIDDISLAKRDFDLSINAFRADFSSSFFTLKRNIDNSYNATYTRNQIDNSFILRTNFDLSLNYLQSYANSSYISKNQLTISFDSIRTLMDVSYVAKNNKVIPGQPQYDYSPSSITPFGQDISGESTLNYFGTYVSLSEDGKIMGVTAPFNNGAGTLRGRARIYKYNDISWVQLGQTIDGEADGDRDFTLKLSKDGTIAAIGSFFNAGKGQVRIFKYNDISWIKQGQDIEGLGAGDGFSRSISLSANGKILAIGAIRNDTTYTDAGQVRVFSYIENDNSWNKIGEFNGFDTYSMTGASVSLSSGGTSLAISSSSISPIQGQVNVYDYSNNTWTPRGTTIFGNGLNTSIYNNLKNFGNNIELSSDGSILAIAERQNPLNNNYGRVMVYNYNSIDNSWNKLGLDINGPTITYFEWDDPNITLSSDGTIIAVGFGSHDSNRGLVRLYKFANNDWAKVGSDILGDNIGDVFGYSVSLSSNGSILAVGAPLYDPSFTGLVRTYNINYAYTVSYTNPTILSNEFTSSFNSFTEKLDISYLLNRVFEASHNNIKTRFDISFATINLTNLELSSIIIETIKTPFVNGINKPLEFIPHTANTAISTTISGDLALTGTAYLKSFNISNKHNFDISINGYSSHYLTSTDVSASIVDYYSNFGSIYNKVFKIDACGNVTNYTNGYGTISDSRLKENIVTSSPKLEDLLKVRVVNYNLKGSDKTKYIGVLAQELEELFPELVTEDSTNERFKSVNYSSLTILLIKAFQEQQVLINNLIATLEELEKESCV